MGSGRLGGPWPWLVGLLVGGWLWPVGGGLSRCLSGVILLFVTTRRREWARAGCIDEPAASRCRTERKETAVGEYPPQDDKPPRRRSGRKEEGNEEEMMPRKDREVGGEDSRILRRLIVEKRLDRSGAESSTGLGLACPPPPRRAERTELRGLPAFDRSAFLDSIPGVAAGEHVRHILSLASRLGKDPGETPRGRRRGIRRAKEVGICPRAPQRDRAQPVRTAGLTWTTSPTECDSSSTRPGGTDGSEKVDRSSRLRSMSGSYQTRMELLGDDGTSKASGPGMAA
ncbi:hypothetical protein THAOC_12428 [Thalassiosira oceanica]|uniref:Uncharacterized protein n=1 Tax=Thalassiosira oceanica TaxID=159749 RepID=K0SNV5_THAOC|nr:hypothetical protein THAOC_12428 [Thalassiosira oceanica]|eukprot:EJK66639.1 hypothetical protein THAOC_12428 [Thalassiosira oceanica]